MRSIWRALRRIVSNAARRAGCGAVATRARGGGAARIGEDTTMLAKLTVEEFAERLAAGTPTPGGGSAAALAGTLSASLLRMVCDLTLGKEQYRAHEEAVRGIRRRAEALKKDLLALVDRDAQAYDGVIRARRLPKGTPAEQEARAAALSRANMFATETPMTVAEACAVLMTLAVELAHKGNSNAVSDVGSAALLAYAIEEALTAVFSRMNGR